MAPQKAPSKRRTTGPAPPKDKVSELSEVVEKGSHPAAHSNGWAVQ